MANRLDTSRMEALLESAALLQSSLDLKTILSHLVRTVMGRLLVRRCAIAVRHRDGQMRLQLVRGATGLTEGSVLDGTALRDAGIERTFPIGGEDPPAGLLGVGGFTLRQIDAEEEEFLTALLGLAASVISNAQAHDAAVTANSMLDQRIQELRALLDLGRGLASKLEADDVAHLVGLTLAGRWALSRYAVLAWHDGHPDVVRQKGLDLKCVLAARDRVAALPEAIRSEDLADSELAHLLALPAGCLLLPIRSGENTSGLVVCGPRLLGLGYRGADLEFGTGLAAQAAVALENAWNVREILVRKQLEKELELAASIQKDLFPSELPQIEGIHLAARNRQARQVGGDYYDALPFEKAAPDQPYLLCVADISGKGLSAALLMSNIQATLRALLRREHSLLEIAGLGNELLYASTPPNKYATAFLFAVDPATGHCRYVNCAHNPTILLRANGKVETLDGPGLALGLFPRGTYAEMQCRLEPGDLLALYSDGVTEAQNSQDDDFGEERLVECLRENQQETPDTIVDHVFEAIDRFAGDAPQHDDITLLIVKKEPTGVSGPRLK